MNGLVVAAVVFAACFTFILLLIGPARKALGGLFGGYQAALTANLARTFSPVPAGAWLGFEVATMAIGAAAAFLIAPNALTGVLMALTAVMVVRVLSQMYVRLLQSRYKVRFEEQFVDAVDMVSNAVKAGLSVIQALEMVAEQHPDPPLGSDIQAVLREIKLGVPLDVALEHWGQLANDDDLDVFVTAVSIQRQTGGNLAEVLENMTATIRERRRIHKQIRALTAQGRLSGTVLSLLPLVLALAITAIAPQYSILVLFKHPLGVLILGVGAFMLVLGALMVRRIVSIDV